MSCATTEGLLRGMLVRLDFSADDLFIRHLAELDQALGEIERQDLRHASVAHLRAAHDAIEAAAGAFGPWRYSSDPEHAHLPLFQREALRLLETATIEREEATRLAAP